MRRLMIALVFLLMSTGAQAQTLRLVPQGAPAPSYGGEMAQTIQEFPVGTPLNLQWDYTDAQIPQATEFRVQIGTNPAVAAGTPTLGINTYTYAIPAAQLVAGTHTLTMMACNESGCSSLAIQVRMRRPIPPPPGNGRVSPRQQAHMTTPIPMDRAADVAIKYADLAYNVQLRPDQLGVVAQFHPPNVSPTPWSVIQAVDKAVERYLPSEQK
jgi:hypothetical protein